MRVLSEMAPIPRRRLAKLLLLPILVTGPVWAGARLMIAMNAEAPVREALALKTALEGARKARAKEFAAADLRTAEAAVDQAITEYYRTVSEKTGFLRYDLVRRHLYAAHEKVSWAWTRARQRGDASRDYARRLIDEGQSRVQAADRAIESSPVAPAVRANLARARVAIQTAAARWDSGDFDAAVRDASFAKKTAEEISGRVSSFLETYTTSASAQKWARWIRQTIDLSRTNGGCAVVVDKLNHKCYLYRSGTLERIYAADLGGTIQDKMRAGDRATPEGMYRIIQKKGPGQTVYRKALLINYPNDEDRADFALAKRKGWVSRYARIGGLIEIHGEGGRREDWTLGCVALANGDMDELFRVASVGTPVTIVGTMAR